MFYVNSVEVSKNQFDEETCGECESKKKKK